MTSMALTMRIQQDLKEWMRSRQMVLKLRMAMVALPKITAGTSA